MSLHFNELRYCLQPVAQVSSATLLNDARHRTIFLSSKMVQRKFAFDGKSFDFLFQCIGLGWLVAMNILAGECQLIYQDV